MRQPCFVSHICSLNHQRGSLHLRWLGSISHTWSQEIHSWWKVAQRMYLLILLVTMSMKEELLSNDNIHMSIQCIYSPRHHISLHPCQFLFPLAPYCQLNIGSQDTSLSEVCNEQIWNESIRNAMRWWNNESRDRSYFAVIMENDVPSFINL